MRNLFAEALAMVIVASVVSIPMWGAGEVFIEGNPPLWYWIVANAISVGVLTYGEKQPD